MNPVNYLMNIANYMQIVEQTDEEKLKMYMKQSKKDLAKMLIEANKHLDRLSRVYREEQIKGGSVILMGQ